MKKKILEKTKKMRTSLMAIGAMSLMATPAMASETGLVLNFAINISELNNRQQNDNKHKNDGLRAGRAVIK
mgnify:CR=1 FL=1